MRIATWNIGGGFVLSNKNKYDIENLNYFIGELKATNADIICFQEVHYSNNNDQAKIIANHLGFEYSKTHPLADSHLKDDEKLSVSVISKYPIISSEFNLLPNPNIQFIWKGKKVLSHDKGFLNVIIDYNGFDVEILSGHMVPFRKAGKDFLDDEFKKIRDEIERIILSKKIPKIICADMNFNGDIKELIPAVFENNFSFILNNQPTTPKGRNYDKIVISKDWKFINSHIVKGKADHFLCVADVELKK